MQNNVRDVFCSIIPTKKYLYILYIFFLRRSLFVFHPLRLQGQEMMERSASENSRLRIMYIMGLYTLCTRNSSLA